MALKVELEALDSVDIFKLKNTIGRLVFFNIGVYLSIKQ